VATETPAGKDRLHVLIEIETPRNLRSVATEKHADCKSRNKYAKA